MLPMILSHKMVHTQKNEYKSHANTTCKLFGPAHAS